ncbi:protein of unknown function [Kyrpidia spormannii]|uniref:Uncharacterized protein n=2 Tax=Kyrpidia spormannii TaxID=2055160 RepID=A0ACA8Z6Y9_9BACL|nr:protein of unknown function [Kyrpidia spormannii]CAB3391618.1 protein of unknown function [Kyrpidia spormannii]
MPSVYLAGYLILLHLAELAQFVYSGS